MLSLVSSWAASGRLGSDTALLDGTLQLQMVPYAICVRRSSKRSCDGSSAAGERRLERWHHRIEVSVIRFRQTLVDAKQVLVHGGVWVHSTVALRMCRHCYEPE